MKKQSKIKNITINVNIVKEPSPLAVIIILKIIRTNTKWLSSRTKNLNKLEIIINAESATSLQCILTMTQSAKTPNVAAIPIVIRKRKGQLIVTIKVITNKTKINNVAPVTTH